MRKGLLALALLCVAALAVKRVSLSLNFKREPLSSALIEIAETAEIDIIADTSRSARGYEPRVTGEWREVSVEEVLEEIAQSLEGAWGWYAGIVYFRQMPWIVAQEAQDDPQGALVEANLLARTIIAMRPEVMSTGTTVVPMNSLPPSIRSRLVNTAFTLQPLTGPSAPLPAAQEKITWREFNEATLKVERLEERIKLVLVDKRGREIAKWEVSGR